MEIETETIMPVDFSTWSKERKAALIYSIQNGGLWNFEGIVYLDYDPEPVYDESRS